MFLSGCLSAIVFARLYQPIRGICRVSDHERIFVRMWNDIRVTDLKSETHNEEVGEQLTGNFSPVRLSGRTW